MLKIIKNPGNFLRVARTGLILAYITKMRSNPALQRDGLMLRKIFTRRKHSRFHAKEKTFIVFQPFTPDEQKLQIIDISEGGCAFIYTGEEQDLDAIGQVNLMCDNVHQVDSVTFSKVRDEHLSGPFRKRSVEFRWLGTVDKAKLKKFVEQAALCKC